MAPTITRFPIIRKVRVHFDSITLSQTLADKARELTGETGRAVVNIERSGNLHTASVSFEVIIANAQDDPSSEEQLR